ncbi:MAG: hypothetical protein KDB00_00490 [Planctomycetales bacterium]|nr:hypothetical protein [Planctomycetales bacterium]
MASLLPDATVTAYWFKDLADLETLWIASIDSLKSIRGLTSADPFVD